MPEFTNPVPGNFCWVELNTNDVAAQIKLYSQLFGWTTSAMPMPNGGTYTIAQIGETKHVAGIAQLSDEAKKMGAPPHWLSHVATKDTEAAAAKATKLGGKVLAGPVAMGPGKWALIQDPTGAVFALWQSEQSMGTFVYGETGALCWNELMTTNVDVAGKFYTNLFGWKAEAQSMPGGMVYTTFKNGDAFAGGMMALPPEAKGAPSSWTAYFASNDADATVAKAQKLGCSVVHPPTDIPGIGRFSILRDPQNAVFAVIKFAPPASK